MSSLNDEDRENLAAYLDGELDEKAAQELEAKLNRDPEARKELDSLRQAWSMLEFLPRPEPSPNFTNRTMERLTLSLPRGAATAKVPVRPHGWSSVLGWTAALLLALALGAVAGNALWRVREPEDAVAAAIAQQRRVVENFPLYEAIVDFRFLESLDHPDLFGEEPAGDDTEPKPCALPSAGEKQLRLQARAFVELPAERREQMVKLDRDLYALEGDVRDRLLRVACRFREWFDRLGVKEKDRVMHADHDRLVLIKGLRHLQRSWDLASRYWNELRNLRIKDLPAEVQDYYKDYLVHMLTAEEQRQLDRADGKDFLKTLVQLADKHPLALEGPRKFADVPKKIKDSIPKAKKLKKDTFPDLGREIAEFALKKGFPPFPYELWACNEKSLSEPMQVFVAHLLENKDVTAAERDRLRKAVNKWPDYPQAIQDIAKAHGLQPPWFTLPPSRQSWENYRSP